MVRNIRVRFDGRVLVPEEPLDLPRDSVLMVSLSNIEAQRQTANVQTALQAVLAEIEALPAPESSNVDGASEHDHYLYGWPKRSQP